MTIIRALLACTTLTIPATALAAPEKQSIIVEAGDLDSESREGQGILALRIHRAARAICKTQALISLPRNIRSERRCVREAQASAEAAVESLTATGNARSGKGG